MRRVIFCDTEYDFSWTISLRGACPFFEGCIPLPYHQEHFAGSARADGFEKLGVADSATTTTCENTRQSKN